MTTVTRTINPLPFVDLEPHRFEDLVRQLSYDFKDWHSIEATGRGGNDDGFDIRAWEKTAEVTNQNEGEEQEEGSHPMTGNLWMIQCKREKEIGPKRVAEIITESIKDKPPYGFILAAPVNFSKTSYDSFREELIKKGVTEFYLWGRAELEDMLYMPKNDRILFTFFGISLVVQKRAKIRDIKFTLNNKNKLMKILGERVSYQSILIRDIDAEHYPFKDQYKDFKEKPRWSERIAAAYHPLGLMFDLRRYYAYIDIEKKEFDFVKAVDLVNKQKDRNDRQEDHELEGKIRDFWEHLPKKNQGTFIFEGLLHFEDMLIIDEKGDMVYDFPHVFVDDRAFRWRWEKIEIGNLEVILQRENYKKINFFPKKFPKNKKGKIHEDKIIGLPRHALNVYRNGLESTELFDIDRKYKDVEVRDSFPLKNEPGESSSHRQLLEVTYIYETIIKAITSNFNHIKAQIEQQVGRAVSEDEKITVFEVKMTYDWEIRQNA